MKNLILVLAALLAASCTKSGLEHDARIVASPDLDHGMIELGERLDDPYTVENMEASLNDLYPTKAERVVLSATHYYVRFLPTGEAQYDRLEAMGVEMIDHPLDYSIVKEGDYYHDPGIDDESITWQYAVVSCDFPFPADIRHEIVDECFFAENAPQTKALEGIDWEAVERNSYVLTGNAAMLKPATKGSYPETCPSGRITVVDDYYGQNECGVAGVQVSCNSFVKFAHAYTDKDGYYKMNRTFTTDLRYRLVFKNEKGFGIGFNLLLIPASISTLGKNSPLGVNVRVDKFSEEKLFSRCVVNNAAYEYYERCKEDGCKIKTPPGNLRIWLFQLLSRSSSPMLQQGILVDNSILKEYLGIYLPLLKLFLPDIMLGLKDRNDYASIYNETVHELSHASHFVQAGKQYWETFIKFILVSYVTSGWMIFGNGTEENHGYCEVAEMWAFYHQTKLFRDRYRTNSVTFGGSYWFSPQIFLNIDQRGIDRFRIFRALRAEITDVEDLQSELINLYPESRSTINQAFDRYE